MEATIKKEIFSGKVYDTIKSELNEEELNRFTISVSRLPLTNMNKLINEIILEKYYIYLILDVCKNVKIF